MQTPACRKMVVKSAPKYKDEPAKTAHLHSICNSPPWRAFISSHKGNCTPAWCKNTKSLSHKHSITMPSFISHLYWKTKSKEETRLWGGMLKSNAWWHPLLLQNVFCPSFHLYISLRVLLEMQINCYSFWYYPLLMLCIRSQNQRESPLRRRHFLKWVITIITVKANPVAVSIIMSGQMPIARNKIMIFFPGIVWYKSA